MDIRFCDVRPGEAPYQLMLPQRCELAIDGFGKQ